MFFFSDSFNMSKYITAIALSRSQAKAQQLLNQGFIQINVILNKDKNGNPLYFWYKKQEGVTPISRIQLSYRYEMSAGLSAAGYSNIDDTPIAPNVFIWYYRGNTKYDTPIVKLEVSTNADDEAEKMKLGWEKVGCNLSGDDEKWVYLWLKRETLTFICDITATNSFGSDEDYFNDGYIRIDQTTKTVFFPFVPGPVNFPSSNFIWYRQTTEANSKSSVTDMKISTSTNMSPENQGYTPVAVNLNEGEDGTPVYLWYKKQENEPPVQSMLLLLQKSAISTYQKAGINTINLNINPDNNEDPRYICFFTKP